MFGDEPDQIASDESGMFLSCCLPCFLSFICPRLKFVQGGILAGLVQPDVFSFYEIPRRNEAHLDNSSNGWLRGSRTD
jgi:hypothetical protein